LDVLRAPFVLNTLSFFFLFWDSAPFFTAYLLRCPRTSRYAQHPVNPRIFLSFLSPRCNLFLGGVFFVNLLFRGVLSLVVSPGFTSRRRPQPGPPVTFSSFQPPSPFNWLYNCLALWRNLSILASLGVFRAGVEKEISFRVLFPLPTFMLLFFQPARPRLRASLPLFRSPSAHALPPAVDLQPNPAGYLSAVPILPRSPHCFVFFLCGRSPCSPLADPPSKVPYGILFFPRGRAAFSPSYFPPPLFFPGLFFFCRSSFPPFALFP